MPRKICAGIAEPSGEPAPMGQKTKYNDNIFDRAFMSLFARKMANVTGTLTCKCVCVCVRERDIYEKKKFFLFKR